MMMNAELTRVPLEQRFERLTHSVHSSPDYAVSAIGRVAGMTLREYCSEADALDGRRRGGTLYDDLRKSVDDMNASGAGAVPVSLAEDMTVASLAQALRDLLLRCDTGRLSLPRSVDDATLGVMPVVDCLARPLGFEYPDDDERKDRERCPKQERTLVFTAPIRREESPFHPVIVRVSLDDRIRSAKVKARDRAAAEGRLRERTAIERMRRLQLSECFDAYALMIGDVAEGMRSLAFARAEKLGMPESYFPTLGEMSLRQIEMVHDCSCGECGGYGGRGGSDDATSVVGGADADVNVVAFVSPLAKMADLGLAG